jgi:hypothetical protein
MRKNLNS